MNSVLDVLKLRHVRLNYISPAICPPMFSGSGTSMISLPVEGPYAPTGLRLEGQCNRFLTWDDYPGLSCVSLYQANDPGDLMGPYSLVTECAAPRAITVITPGWWSYTTTDAEGEESLRSEPVLCDGVTPAQVFITTRADVVSFTLYKNPNPADIGMSYYPVLTSTRFGAFEVSEVVGCYKLQAITETGASELSAPICSEVSGAGCCPAQVCADGYAWDFELCSCTPFYLLGPDRFCVGAVYSSQFEAMGATGPCLWELVSGSFPPGLTFTPGTYPGTTAPVTGTPTSGGDYTVTVRCTPSGSGPKEATFTLSGIGITQYGALPDATCYTAYSEALAASGGTPGYAFALASGSLPDGFSLSAAGVLAGTADTSGVFSFSVEVTDSAGVKCEIPLILTVNGCPARTSYPLIADWGGNLGSGRCATADFDSATRTFWTMTNKSWAENPPGSGRYLGYLGLVDTAAAAALGFATDPANYVSSPQAGDWGNSNGAVFVDTVNDRILMVTNQEFWLAFSRTTYECLARTYIPVGTSFNQRLACYDPGRGRVYAMVPAAGGGYLGLWEYNCTPPVSKTPSSPYFLAGPTTGGWCGYSPLADRVYMNSYSGAADYHKWNPNTGLFETNIGSAAGGTSRLLYFAGLDIVLVEKSGHFYFYDASGLHSGGVPDTYLGHCGGKASIQGYCYNSCTGKIYISNGGEQGGGVWRITPQLTTFPYSFTDVVQVLSGTYYAMAFDPDQNLVFAVNQSTGEVATVDNSL